MPNTVNLGRLFVTVASQAQGAPIVDRCLVVEKEGAARTGQGWLVRPPFTKHRPVLGLVVGVWRRPPSGPGVGPSTGA